MAPGLIVMDEPESALSPQRQLSLLAQMVRLVRDGGAQFVIATHSPILMTYPGAALLSFDGGTVAPTRLRTPPTFRSRKEFSTAPGGTGNTCSARTSPTDAQSWLSH